ncbi:MAG: thiamine pyrophosphate-dependent dehydrogenase E1 component subunit alpha [Sulfuricaulis sp.]|nr:thiamine pyrophosphate-dependent dehydrogenase E1 component subunit alpha [Sulfuricaulis sp.]
MKQKTASTKSKNSHLTSASLSAEQKLLLYRNLTRAMTLDRLMVRLLQAGSLLGFYHDSGISAAAGVAAGSFLRQEDIMFPHSRGHGIGHMISKGINVASYVAEHMGREAGCCKGRSSYHWSYPDDHVHGFSGNVGAGFGLSVGWGLAARNKRSGQIVMSCSGDGSYGNGRSHEAMLMTSIWKLPVIFWCEANGMVQHTNIDQLFPGPDISALAAGYGMPSMIVDGEDLFACGEAALAAIAHTRAGKGPFFVECKTRRAGGHAVGLPNLEGTALRDQELMQEWRATGDPLKRASERLIAEGLLTLAQAEQIQADADKEGAEMVAFSEASPRALPSIEELEAAVYAD